MVPVPGDWGEPAAVRRAERARADGALMSPRACPAFVAVSPDRKVHCTHRAGHGPAEDMHQGLLRVTLPDGREHAASLVWSTSPVPGDEEHLRRSE